MDAAPPATDDRSRLSVKRPTAALLGIQALLVSVCLFVYLDGFHRDFRVPVRFAEDSLQAIMQSKSTIDNGWWWFNPMLGAPYGLDELAFPANTNVDQAIVWAVSRPGGSATTAINLAWLLMVVLSGVSATWCLRKLGASSIGALVGGTLFALSPYSVYRNIEHFWMVTYLVPFACTAALLLATARPQRWHWGRGHALLLAGCALLGFDYIYYAFFACFVLAVGTVAGYVASKRPVIVDAGVACVALVGVTTMLNLAPSLQSWSRNGKPLLISDKRPAESEVYGLKIRQLISPSFPHFFPPFRTWTARERAARFPNDNENQFSRLGVVATVGFLGLLGVTLFPALVNAVRDRALLIAAGQVTLATVLLATVGGFGSVIGLLLTPQIRAYNRVAPFIAFFSLAAVVFVLDSIFTRRRGAIAALAVLGVGLVDQRVPPGLLNAEHADIAVDVTATRAFVEQLESRLPEGAMVLQLPFRAYLNDSGVARMGSYDHLRLYAFSRRLRWSYPALSNEQVRWQQAAARLAPQELARAMAAQGFAAIVIDRFGYDDGAAAITAGLRSSPGGEAVLATNDRYLALDIRALAGAGRITPAEFLARGTPATSTLPACGDPTHVFIDQIGPVRWPFTEQPVRVPAAAGLRIGGWAVDLPGKAVAAAVDVVLDRQAFPAVYGLDRADVVQFLKQPVYLSSGFTAEISAESASPGAHTLSVRVVAADRRCYYEGPPIRVVIE